MKLEIGERYNTKDGTQYKIVMYNKEKKIVTYHSTNGTQNTITLPVFLKKIDIKYAKN